MHSRRIPAMQLYFNISIHERRKYERNFYKAIYTTLRSNEQTSSKETKTFTRIKLLTKVTRLLTFIAANEHIGI